MYFENFRNRRFAENIIIGNNGVFVSSNWNASNKIPCTPLTDYTLSNITLNTEGYWIFFDSNENMLSYEPLNVNKMAVATPSGCAVLAFYCRFSGDVMLNSGSTALPYEPYGYKIPIVLAGQTQNVYLTEPLRKALDGSDAVDVLRSDGTLTREVDSNGDALVTPTTETVTVPTLTPTKGANTLTIGTTLQPSEVSITGGIK